MRPKLTAPPDRTSRSRSGGRARRTLGGWVVLGVLGSACSLTLDLDRYAFGEPPKSNEGGQAGEGGEAGAQDLGGRGGKGGQAGSSVGGRGGTAAGGAAGEAPGGAAGEAPGGAAGEGGAGPVSCDGEEALADPRCELAPVAVYVMKESSSPNLVGFGVEPSGGLDATPLSVIQHASSVSGDLLSAPDRQHVVALSGKGGQITHTFNVDPDTLELEESLQTQPMETSGEPTTQYATGAMLAGPAGLDHDFLLVANGDSNGSGGGVYLYSFDHDQYPGRIAQLERLSINKPWSPVFDPSGAWVYVIQDPYSFSSTVNAVSFDAQAGTLSPRDTAALDINDGYPPQQVAVAPSGELVYVLFGDHLESFSVRSFSPRLAPYAGSTPNGNLELSRMAVHPAGGFVYAVGGDALWAFKAGTAQPELIDLDDDTLNGVSGIPLTRPGDLAVNRTGRHLFVTTDVDTHSFQIQPDGTLTEPSPPVAGRGTRLAILHAVRKAP